MALEETPRECLTKHCWKTNASYAFFFPSAVLSLMVPKRHHGEHYWERGHVKSSTNVRSKESLHQETATIRHKNQHF